MTTDKTPQQRHAEALRAQLGSAATAAQLALIDRVGGLLALCEAQESELAKSGRMRDEKSYHSKCKLVANGLVALGLSRNPRTARADAIAADAHAAMLDD